MANKNLTIDMITAKCLDILELETPLLRNANRQYDSSFAVEGAKIGDTLRVRLPDRYLVTKGAALGDQDAEENYTNVKITDQAHVPLKFTAKELELDIDDFANRKLKPAISQLAAQVEMDIAERITPKFFHSVGTPGTTPATSKVILDANQKLNEANVPMSGRNMTVNPAANGALIEGMKGLFNPTGTISKQFKTGLMGEGILGLADISMGQAMSVHANGDWGTAITVTSTMSTQGSSTLGISFTGSSKTWNAGDVFTIAGVYMVNPQTRKSTGYLQQFTVAAEATGSSTATLTVYPEIYTAGEQLATVDTFPQSGAAVTMFGAANGVYPQNLVTHDNCYTLAMADLEVPQGVHMSSRKQHAGMSLRIVKDYDINADTFPCRVDILYGIDVLRQQEGVRVWG